MHGDTVALQTFVRNKYLSCGGRLCGNHPCPKMEMAGTDWTRCYGEVFEIYSKDGPGPIKNGATVGLHYPREKGKWFGCPAVKCDKRPCPGTPTSAYGFASQAKWHQCWGEVFRIYTKQVAMGVAISSDDDIFLYYVRGKQSVSQGPIGFTFKTFCFGTSFPPAPSKFDGCVYETFRLWKKPSC